jgi:HlyD family secretion protein
MTRIVVILAVVVLLVGLLLFSQQQSGPLVVSGSIEADEIRVGSRVGGRVLKVLVSEGDQVSSGATLVELEPFDLNERLAELQQRRAQADAVHDKLVAGFRPEEIAQAHARQKQLQAALDKLNNGPRAQEIAASEASLRLAEAELSLAIKVHQRTETLFGQQSIEKNKLDESATALRVAQAAVDAQSQQLALLQEGSRKEDIARAAAQLEEASQELALRKNGYRSEDVREAEAKLDSADAAWRAVERQLEELLITAPSDCVVEAIELQPGDLLSPNMPAVSLVNAQKLWVRAYVPENHLNIATGQSVAVQVDSFPGRKFSGEVVFIASQAEFTPANVQTPEERSKQVFRIKVRLVDGLDLLRPGMAADVLLPVGSGKQQ